MKYYKSKVELGHMGCGKELSSWVYVKAKDILKAMSKVRKIPAVKHNKIPIQIIEITEEEYTTGITSKNYYEKMDQLFGV